MHAKFHTEQPWWLEWVPYEKRMLGSISQSRKLCSGGGWSGGGGVGGFEDSHLIGTKKKHVSD